MEFNEETNIENMEHAAMEAISVVKIMCAIMNDEEDIDAYEEKSKEEMVEIIESINARFPNNDHVSYDPAYLRFGQACINGYNTFVQCVENSKVDIESLDKEERIAFIPEFLNIDIDNISIDLE